MSTFPEGQPYQRKEQILARSPYLRKFLEIGNLAKVANPGKWGTDLQGLEEPIVGEIKDKLGSNWEIITAPLSLLAERYKLFDRNILTSNERERLVLSYVLIGYEVGNQEDVELMFEDITKQLANARAFNADLMRDRRTAAHAIDSTYTMMLIGAFIKTGKIRVEGDFSKLDPNDKANHTAAAGAFKQYIEGLNFNLDIQP